MPTSDERREVAARLRGGVIARNIPEAYVAIVQSIGVRPCLLLHEGESGDRFDLSAYESALNRLADLIDPTCEVEESRGETDPFPVYAWEWKLSCGHIVRTAWDDPPSYCSECGARVVSSDDNQ